MDFLTSSQVHSPHTLLILFISLSLSHSLLPTLPLLWPGMIASPLLSSFLHVSSKQIYDAHFSGLIALHRRHCLSLEINRDKEFSLSLHPPTGRNLVVRNPHPCSAAESSVIGVLAASTLSHLTPAFMFLCVCVWWPISGGGLFCSGTLPKLIQIYFLYT